MFQDIPTYHRQLASGATTCAAAVTHYLQVAAENAHLNALVRVFGSEALERAHLLDERRLSGKAMGKLHGVVVTIKDVISIAEQPLTAASRILEGYTASFNATVIERLLAAEAILIGMNNCDEFAMGSSNENSVYGPVRNAADPKRVPGGSSGGSAVAVQAGLCMVSLGSDTGGSVRQPADFCGVVGLKPTYGRVSRHGLIAYGSSFDQIGVLATNVADTALVLEVIAGADGYDATASQQTVEPYSQLVKTPVQKPVLGYYRQMLEHPALDPEIRNTLQLFLDVRRAEGYTVRVLEFDLINYIVPTYYVLTTAEASSNLSRYDGVRYGYVHQPAATDLTDFYAANRSHGFGAEVQRRILLGNFVLSAGYFDAYYTKAQQVRRKLFDHTNQIFKEIDLLVAPVSPGTAFLLGEKTNDPLEMYLADMYTVYANLTGIPALALPLFRHSNGLPYGLQLHARHLNEVSLLQTGHHWMQQAVKQPSV